MTRPMAVSVALRTPYPPHETIMHVTPARLSYGFLLGKKQSASFVVSRADANLLLNISTELRVGLRVSIERDDGRMPWVGWITGYDASYEDPDATFICEDDAWLLQQAITRRGMTFQGSAGDLISQTINEMNDRGQPSVPIGLSNVVGGPALDWVLKAEKGLDFLTRVADIVGWEWGFAHTVTPSSARTALLWAEQMGRDRRQEIVLTENKHFTSVKYSERAEGFIAAGVAIGGTGDFGERPGAIADERGRSEFGRADVVIASRPPGLSSPATSGTALLIEQSVTDSGALLAAARRQHTTPKRVGRQVSFRLFESSLSPFDLQCGDQVHVELENTLLGGPTDFDVRILGIKLDPVTLEHDFEVKIDG